VAKPLFLFNRKYRFFSINKKTSSKKAEDVNSEKSV